MYPNQRGLLWIQNHLAPASSFPGIPRGAWYAPSRYAVSSVRRDAPDASPSLGAATIRPRRGFAGHSLGEDVGTLVVLDRFLAQGLRRSSALRHMRDSNTRDAASRVTDGIEPSHLAADLKTLCLSTVAAQWQPPVSGALRFSRLLSCSGRYSPRGYSFTCLICSSRSPILVPGACSGRGSTAATPRLSR